MDISAFSSKNHPDYRENTVIGVIAAVILEIDKGETVTLSSVHNAMDDKVSWSKVRMAILKIGEAKKRRYKTALKDDQLVIRAL